MARKRRTGTDSIPRRLARPGFRSYGDYLASPHWADVKRRFYASRFVSRAPDGKACCAACRQTGLKLSVHHRTYKRLGSERLSDLMAACDECHKAIHSYGYKGDLWGTTNHIVRVKQAEKDGKSLSYAVGQVVKGDPNDPVRPPWECIA